MEELLNPLFGRLFYKPLALVFGPINGFLGWLPDWLANICGIGLFIGAMIWVSVFLNSNYVNRGRPYKGIWSDLRLWTCLSMLPHVLFYFYFR